MDAQVFRENDVEEIQLRLTREELVLLAASVNEAIEAVEDWEFSTRLGADKDEARRVRAEIGAIVRRLPPLD